LFYNEPPEEGYTGEPTEEVPDPDDWKANYDKFANNFFHLYKQLSEERNDLICEKRNDETPSLKLDYISCICSIFQRSEELNEYSENFDAVLNATDDLVNLFKGIIEDKFLPRKTYIKNPGNPCEKYYLVNHMYKTMESAFNYITDSEEDKIHVKTDDLYNILGNLEDDLAARGVFLCSKDVLHQSPYLHIQSVGSDEGDQTVEGIHTRWQFLRKLGKEHLPKGDLSDQTPYKTSIRFNKQDDYVKLFKTFYEPNPLVLDFSEHNPDKIIDDTEVKKWKFHLNNNGFASVVEISFLNPSAYANVAQNINPSNNPQDFLNNYDGIWTISMNNKLMFATEFEFSDLSAGSIVKLEGISNINLDTENNKRISYRKAIEDFSDGNLSEKVFGENLEHFRIQYEEGNIQKIKLEAYKDFYWERVAHWEYIDKFSLTMDTNVAHTRLEDNNIFTIDQTWPAFNEGNTVSVDSYKNKWQADGGIKELVRRYLARSTNDVYANDELTANVGGDDGKFNISYLEALNWQSLDFHIARMLGLGHIDTEVDSNKYMYMALYQTDAYEIGMGEKGNMITHLRFSLPTTKQDDRLPPEPSLDSVTGGKPSQENSDNFLSIDQSGYADYYQMRFVHLHRQSHDFEIPYEGFFESGGAWDMSKITLPIFNGIEYKRADLNGTPPANYVNPEITAYTANVLDDEYKVYDANGNLIAEPIPVPDKANPIFLHKHYQEGEHFYALYAINWFSRVSSIGNEQSIETEFDPINTLMPPLDVQAQFIQVNSLSPLLTDYERNNYPGYTRLTFNWNHIQNIAYQKATKTEFYFRENPPLEIRGAVKKVEKIAGSNILKVHAKPFDIVSKNPVETISPNIQPGNENKFIGAFLSTLEEEFKVVDVVQNSQQNPDGPIFTIEPVTEANNSFNHENNEINLHKVTKQPKEDARFHIRENLNDPAQWTKLDKTVIIQSFSNHEETYQENDGQSNTIPVNGIYNKATVTASSTITGVNDITGLYKIEFNSYNMADHPQQNSEDVNWEQGTVRIALQNNPYPPNKRVLEVWKIENQNPLTIWAYDPQESSGTEIIQSGTDVDVNFHPGYKVYVDQEPTNNFDDEHILPASGGGSKTTYLALRSIDDTQTPTLKSYFSPPIPLIVNEIQVPIPPYVPTGPTFATRPDYFGKSTYTFDVKVDTTNGRTPYGLVFYKANERMILDALYQPQTVENIIAQLKNDDFYNDKFSDLVNVVLDNTTHAFKDYGTGYHLPDPDKSSFPSSYNSLTEKEGIIRDAINQLFVPLTKAPVIYEHIQQGKQTSKEEPVIKDEAGRMLDPSDPDYYPYPMIRKYQDGSGDWYVRFTDYELDGDANNQYFYFAEEFTNQYEHSDRSPVNGPIHLINSNPPQAPVLKSTEAVLAQPSNGIPAAVQFRVNPYPDAANVEKFRIYRSLSEVQAKSTRLMTLANVVNADDAIEDDFNNVPYPPYGDTIYYRIVALKKITNEQNNTEWVPSIPSKVVEAKVVDNVNPPAPTITPVYTTNYKTSQKIQPTSLTGVKFKWPKVAHNATYYLYKMNEKGNWVKILQESNNNDPVSVYLSDANGFGSNLNKEDSDGNTIYHRFKVEVENASGLLNIEDKEITI